MKRNLFAMFFPSFQIEDLLKIHHFISGNHVHEPIIQLSLDGVSESKSSSTGLDTYSVKFNHCRNIYPIRIIRPCEKYKYDVQEQLQNVLDDINDNGVVIDCCVCDNPVRSNVIRCAKCHSAKFPCEYCQCGAVVHVQTDKKT